jgi:hypothetical protein
MQIYSHKGTSEESLHIYLFTMYFRQKIDSSHINLAQYQQFELRDEDIDAYNHWVGDGCKNIHILYDWIQKNEQHVAQFHALFGDVYKPKVSLWSDRKKTNYYKEKLQASFEFENYIEDFFRYHYGLELGTYITPEGQYYEGENELGIEIKNDTLIKKYGNIYIEYAEKSNSQNGQFVRSGILKNDKSVYFLIGDKTEFWIFKKARLIEIFKEEYALHKQGLPSTRHIKFKEIPTSMGIVYPVRIAKSEAITVEQLVDEIMKKSNLF